MDIARSKSATIKRIIESKRYQEVFPSVRLLKNVTSNEYWSIDHKFAGIDTTGEEQFTLCAAGLKGSVTSKRSHLVMIDDAIKSAADIANPDIRKQMQENWNAVIAPTMFEGARAIAWERASDMTTFIRQHLTNKTTGARLFYRPFSMILKQEMRSPIGRRCGLWTT